MSSFPRRRGAPPGNNNAFKHGFYSRRPRRPLTDEETSGIKSLTDEIALIRIFTHKLVASCQSSVDHKQLADTLRTLCLASAAITRILRIYYVITGSQSGLDPDIESSIARLTAGFSGDAAANASFLPSSASDESQPEGDN